MPAIAAPENQAALCWPRGTTTNAASSGPMADPVLPPTWNSDWANPCRPPDASRATRLDSGWKTAEPSPTIAAESSRTGKLHATESARMPTRLSPMPATSEYGFGWWSVYRPTSGWSNEAVSWNVSVMSPICPKSRPKSRLMTGYRAGSSACIMSFRR